MPIARSGVEERSSRLRIQRGPLGERLSARSQTLLILATPYLVGSDTDAQALAGSFQRECVGSREVPSIHISVSIAV